MDGRPSNSPVREGVQPDAAGRPVPEPVPGFVVDSEALRRHLLSGHLVGAVVDVFPEKPRSVGDEFTSVNLPQLALPPTGGSHRLAHLHSNVPGAMAEINSVLAAHGVNVEAQFSTRSDLGYALTDIDVDYPNQVAEQLRAMSPTVRLRVLS
jgi:D-3-phosphoglycerate dehydrogenase / 2-oxoglutarate reductase